MLEQVKEFFGGAGSISISGNMYFYSSRTSQTINIFSVGPLIYLYPGYARVNQRPKARSPWQANNKFLPLVRHYSSKSTPVLYSDKKMDNSNLNPNWLTGFSDGESSFIITISKNSKCSTGWTVIPSFQISLHVKDIKLLETIQKFFGVGIINKRLSKAEVSYSVTKNKDLLGVIIPHFDKYPLISKKKADFLLFKAAVLLCSKKEHLNKEGLRKIVALRASMNKGLTEVLKKEFTDIIPENRPIVDKPLCLDPNWVSGFIAAEGCFYVYLSESKNRVGYSTSVMFSVCQHIRDLELIESFMTFFNCGQVKKDSRDLNSGVYFNVTSFLNILDKVIPFFEQYPIIGNKSLDYQDFLKVVLLIKNKAHLTEKGLKDIQGIKANMNSNRLIILQSGIGIGLFSGIVKSLLNVRRHFEEFPLQTTKYIHFKLWCQVMDIIENKEHLTKQGFYKILSIKSLFPKGLSDKLLEVYSKENIIPTIKPVFEPSSIKLDPNWIVGFVQADGTFGLNYIKQPRMKLGYTCQPQFRVTQHERDLIVLKRIIESMGCGTIVRPPQDRDRYNISVANISDLINIVIPLFEKYPLSPFWGGPPKKGRGGKVSRFFGFSPRGLHYERQRTFNYRRVKVLEGYSIRHEYIQKVLVIMYLGYFIFYNVDSFILLVLELIVCCRWLMKINQLLYRYLLGQLYNKLIHIFAAMRYKMYKKILWQWPTFVGYWMVNQPVTLLRRLAELAPLALINGTSETACDITFKFNNYLNQKVQHKKKIHKIFLEWFIGFTEGKGTFMMLNNKVYFDISVNIKDIQVLYYIRKELGFGKIIIKKDYVGAPVGAFYVSNYSNFYRLVSLFNGNLCSVNKKQEFKTWLKIFNNQYSKEIIFINRDIKPSLTTGWLSGYIDAVGSFSGREAVENNESKSIIPYLTFYILHKEYYILNVISETLNIKIKNIKQNKDKDGWILSISSFNKLKQIINYLKRYPLKTKKSLAFTKWCKIYNITLNKDHLNKIGLNKIHNLTKEMNNYL